MAILEKLFKYFVANKKNNSNSFKERNSQSNKRISKKLVDNLQHLNQLLDQCSDVIYKDFKIFGTHNAALFFLEGFVDNNLINSAILKPLITNEKNVFNSDPEELNPNNIYDFVKSQLISAGKISDGLNLKDITTHLLSGETILLIDGIEKALVIDLKKFEKRNVEESIIEPTIRGARDSFTEDIITNISLIRRRLKTPKLKLNKLKVGRLSQTTVVISYLDGIADDSLVEEVQKRISRIDIDAVLESGYIEELIEDNHFSFFSQFGYTERPDRLASSLLEGRVGIIIDNTPIVLIAPETFFQAMQSSEDYYERYISGSIIRCFRYFFLLLAFSLPSFYIAVLTFHQGMLPRNLLLNIWYSREGIPFPVLIEALIMEVFFEGLREAGVRLPSIAGQTVSIVGALVIGQAAVQAGIVSSSMVITVSITGISSFIIPRYNLALSVRLLRFILMILAGTLGLYGMFIGFLTILIHLSNLRSFGVPYLSPVAPLDFKSLKDVFIRVPWWAMTTRPGFMNTKNSIRINSKLKNNSNKQHK